MDKNITTTEPTITNEEIIKNFLTKMATQNNRGTASPFFYVIRTEVEDPAPIENCDFTKWYWNDSSFHSKKAMENMMVELGYADDIEEQMKEAHEYGIKKRWEQKGLFLTEDDAKRHLEINHYHYSDNAHTYVDHAWRAPELAGFFKALNAHFGIIGPNI